MAPRGHPDVLALPLAWPVPFPAGTSPGLSCAQLLLLFATPPAASVPRGLSLEGTLSTDLEHSADVFSWCLGTGTVAVKAKGCEVGGLNA